MKHPTILGLVACLLASLATPSAQSSQSHHDMTRRGEHAMGFDQRATVHHFLLERQGGTIEITVRDAADAPTVQQIRTHLAHVSEAFAAGDFSLPMFIHETNPPGVDQLKSRRAQLRYETQEIPTGGRLVIRSGDPEALKALHEFLRFQIGEHKTGDPLTIK
jgi:hypothetical protein